MISICQQIFPSKCQGVANQIRRKFESVIGFVFRRSVNNNLHTVASTFCRWIFHDKRLLLTCFIHFYKGLLQSMYSFVFLLHFGLKSEEFIQFSAIFALFLSNAVILNWAQNDPKTIWGSLLNLLWLHCFGICHPTKQSQY